MVVPGFGPLVEMILGLVNESRRPEQFAARLKRTLPQLKEALAEETHRVYSRLGDQVVRDLSEASRREVEMSLAAIRQAEAMWAAGEQGVAARATTFDEIEAKAELVKAGVDGFRQKLWTRTVLTASV